MNAFWIILAGSLVAVCCSLPGCDLLLRKMSMIGDAISHAVLPGIVIAFLFTGSVDSLPMILGAGTFGLLTAGLIQLLSRGGRLQEDASIGVVYTALFSLGVVLLSAFAANTHLDQDCVLFGEIAYVPLDLWLTDTGLNMGPRTVWLMSGLLLLILLFIRLAY